MCGLYYDFKAPGLWCQWRGVEIRTCSFPLSLSPLGVAQGKGRRRRSSPEEEAAAVAKAAADLRRMNADGVITAGMAGERPLEAAMEVIDALHRSGVGSKFHATHLEEYVKFPEKCAGLCAGVYSHRGQVV